MTVVINTNQSIDQLTQTRRMVRVVSQERPHRPRVPKARGRDRRALNQATKQWQQRQ